MTTVGDVNDVVVATDRRVDELIELAGKLWDPQAAQGVLKVAELVLGVINGDVRWAIEEGRLDDAYAQAVRMHNVCVDVLKSEAPYTDAGAWRVIVNQTVSELQPAAVGIGAILVVGVIAGLFLSRR